MDLSAFPAVLQARPPSYFDLPRMIRAAKERHFFFIDPNRVSVIKADAKMIILFLDDGTHAVGELSIESLMQAFPGVWMRASRGIAVRQRSVAYARDGYVVMDNGEKIRMSRRQREALTAAAVPLYRAQATDPWPDIPAAQ